MAAIQGYGGKVQVGTSVIGEIGSWELEVEAEDIDTTAFGDGWADMIPGLRSWSGSIEGSWDVATAGTNQSLLQNAILNGTSVSLELYVNATNKYSGTAYITSMSVETPVDDKVSISFDFTGSGALTYA